MQCILVDSVQCNAVLAAAPPAVLSIAGMCMVLRDSLRDCPLGSAVSLTGIPSRHSWHPAASRCPPCGGPLPAPAPCPAAPAGAWCVAGRPRRSGSVMTRRCAVGEGSTAGGASGPLESCGLERGPGVLTLELPDPSLRRALGRLAGHAPPLLDGLEPRRGARLVAPLPTWPLSRGVRGEMLPRRRGFWSPSGMKEAPAFR